MIEYNDYYIRKKGRDKTIVRAVQFNILEIDKVLALCKNVVFHNGGYYIANKDSAIKVFETDYIVRDPNCNGYLVYTEKDFESIYKSFKK